MSVKYHFATPVYYEKLKSTSLVRFNEQLLDECYALSEDDVAGQKWSKKNYLGGYSSYSSINNLHEISPTFAALQKEIAKHVAKFSKELKFELGSNKLQMTDCWLNIMPQGTVHGMHIHPISTISGTYYLKTPKGCSSISFEDPRLINFMAAPTKKDAPIVEYEAKEGHVVLFESWLRHAVSANPVPAERISISFNYNWF